MPYVAGYGGENAVEELERCAEAIDAIASGIEDALEVRTEPEDEATA